MTDAPSTALAAAALGLETAVNAALDLDPVAKAKVAALAGTVIEVRCTLPRWCLYLLPGASGIQLKTWHESAVQCSVSGAASDFVALATARDKPSALVNGGLRIHGDSNAFIELGKALSDLDLDWESRLALLLGDIPAHQIGRLVRGSVRFGASTHDRLLRHVEEYVHEEGRLAPPRAEVDDFFTDVRALAQDVERAQARARRLARRLETLARTPGVSRPGRG